MDISEAKDVILQEIEVKLGKMSIHKRLAVLRYMKRYVLNMADFEVEEAIRLNGNELSPELEFKVKQATKGYETWMAKHGRVVPMTPDEIKAKEAETKKVFADLDYDVRHRLIPPMPNGKWK